MKTEEKFIQCSLEVSFGSSRGILKNTKYKQKYFIINTVNYEHLVS